MTTARDVTASRQGIELPLWLEVSLAVLLLAAGLASLVGPTRFSPLPTALMLDAWAGVTAGYLLFKRRLPLPRLTLAIATYAVIVTIIALANHAPPYEFFRAYRWTFYLLVLTLSVGAKWRRTDLLRLLFWALLILMTVKAAIVYLQGGVRPGLLEESNFELSLLIGLGAVLYEDFGARRWLAIAALGLVVMLEQSRSGGVEFLLLGIYAFWLSLRAKRASSLRLAAMPLLLLVPLSIFLARSDFRTGPEARQTAVQTATSPSIDPSGQATGSAHPSIQTTPNPKAERSPIDSIDRVKFARIFWKETKRWSAVNWLFGTPPITPLTEASCQALSRYHRLYSQAGDGRCYAVILHSFLLRVVFDAGLVGLVAILAIVWLVMRRAGVSTPLTLVLIALGLANSASVSGFNGAWVMLPIVLAVMSSGQPPASREEAA